MCVDREKSIVACSWRNYVGILIEEIVFTYWNLLRIIINRYFFVNDKIMENLFFFNVACKEWVSLLKLSFLATFSL